jgi:hypothetical protein
MKNKEFVPLIYLSLIRKRTWMLNKFNIIFSVVPNFFWCADHLKHFIAPQSFEGIDGPRVVRGADFGNHWYKWLQKPLLNLPQKTCPALSYLS